MKLALMLLVVFAPFAFAENKTIGKTYKISEPDPYQEISARSSKIDLSGMSEKIQEKQTFIKKYRVPALPRSRQDAFNLITPLAKSPADIHGKDGLLYPKGFEFNPLEYRTMRGRIVIIDQSDIGKIEVQPLDTVIINKGDLRESSDLLKRPVFILDRLTSATLTQLRSVPTIISQEGKQLRYEEMFIECRDQCAELSLATTSN